jgi:putative MATE family efflux protein
MVCHAVFPQEVHMKNDMTTGKPLKIILTFTLPMLLGSVFQQLYNIVDMLVVGNIIGSRALAAIGATGAASFFAMSLIIGMTTGFTAVVSRHFGAKDGVKQKKAIAATAYITMGITLILVLLGLFGTEPLLRLLNTPEDIFPDALLYLKICLTGSIGMVVFNATAAVLRAVGDSRTPLIFLIISSVLSMLLDFVFILGFGMGVEGAAIATVAAQVLSAAACIVYMVKRFDIFKLRKPDWVPDKESLASILKVGLPVCFQSILLAVGDMTISAVVNSFGADVVAAYATASRVMMTVMMFAMNLAMAYAVFAGQNLGAGNITRIKAGFKDTAKIMVVLSLAMAGLVFIFGDAWVRFFIAETDAHIEAVVHLSQGAMRIPALFYVFLGAIWLYNYTLRGMGDILIPFVSGLAELAAKIGLSVAFAYWFGYMGVWYAMPVGWVLGLVPSVVRFHGGGWAKQLERRTVT